MNAATIPKIKIRRARIILFSLVGIIAFFIFFFETPVIIERMISTLSLCARVLIPTLFPFMVLSELILISGLDRLLDKIFGGALEKIFKLPASASSALILGLLCGFPVGTTISYSLYEKGKISYDVLIHLLLICNIQSSAFIINTVGLSMLGDKRAGFLLYASQIISLLVTGIVYPRIFHIDRVKNTSINLSESGDRHGIALKFTRSIKNSVISMLGICGFVLFFSVLCGIAFDIASRLNIPDIFTLTVCAALEMSCGCLEISRHLCGASALYACASVLAFSGMSLHFQIMSLCKSTHIKYARFFAVKIFSAIIASAAALLLNLIFKIFA